MDQTRAKSKAAPGKSGKVEAVAGIAGTEDCPADTWLTAKHGRFVEAANV